MREWLYLMVFNMDGKTELLVNLLQCGYADIDTLIDVMDMSNELFEENLLYDVIDEYGRELLHFNDLMYHLMVEIVLSLVAELDEEIDDEYSRYIYILDEHWAYPYVNFMDSHFQLECLDGWKSGMDKKKLLDDLREELCLMKTR